MPRNRKSPTRLVPKNITELMGNQVQSWEKNIFYSDDAGSECGHNYKFNLPTISITTALCNYLLKNLPADSSQKSEQKKLFSEKIIKTLYDPDDMKEYFFGNTDGNYTQDCFFGYSSETKRYFFTIRFTLKRPSGNREEVLLNLHINKWLKNQRGCNSIRGLVVILNNYYENLVIPEELIDANENNIPDGYKKYSKITSKAYYTGKNRIFRQNFNNGAGIIIGQIHNDSNYELEFPALPKSFNV